MSATHARELPDLDKVRARLERLRTCTLHGPLQLRPRQGVTCASPQHWATWATAKLNTLEQRAGGMYRMLAAKQAIAAQLEHDEMADLKADASSYHRQVEEMATIARHALALEQALSEAQS